MCSQDGGWGWKRGKVLLVGVEVAEERRVSLGRGGGGVKEGRDVGNSTRGEGCPWGGGRVKQDGLVYKGGRGVRGWLERVGGGERVEWSAFFSPSLSHLISHQHSMFKLPSLTYGAPFRCSSGMGDGSRTNFNCSYAFACYSSLLIR